MTLSRPAFRRLAVTVAIVSLALGMGPLAAAPPANDTCASAVVIPPTGPFPYSTTVDTTQASNDAADPAFTCNPFGNPSPTGAVSRSVWFAFTPSTSDNYQIDTIGSTPGGLYDTILGLFTGSCGSFTPVTDGCNSDTSGSLQSAVQVRLNAGTTYYALVAGLGSRDFATGAITASAGGTLKLNVSRVAVSYPYSYVIPSVAHAQGVTLYVSDLNVTNVDAADGSFYVQFLNHGNLGDTSIPSSQPSNAPTSIRVNGSVQFNDVLANGFGIDTGANPYGALLIRSTVKLLTGARTYTTAAGGGTFGQYALGVDAASSDILNSSESGRLIGVRESANARTNIAVFNTAATACNVKFDLLNASGDLYTGGSSTIRVVPPSTMVQASGLRSSLFGVSDDIVNSTVRITNMTTGCTIGAIAYVIDGNSTPGTNDPFAIPLQK